jgi:hypothetical protein
VCGWPSGSIEIFNPTEDSRGTGMIRLAYVLRILTPTPLPQRKEAKENELCTEGHTRSWSSHDCGCKLRRWGRRLVLRW